MCSFFLYLSLTVMVLPAKMMEFSFKVLNIKNLKMCLFYYNNKMYVCAYVSTYE